MTRDLWKGVNHSNECLRPTNARHFPRILTEEMWKYVLPNFFSTEIISWLSLRDVVGWPKFEGCPHFLLQPQSIKTHWYVVQLTEQHFSLENVIRAIQKAPMQQEVILMDINCNCKFFFKKMFFGIFARLQAGERQEKQGMTSSKGPRLQSNPWPH